MPQDAAASGATSDADSTAKGDQNSDAGTTGDSQPDIEKIVSARLQSKLKQYGDLDELKTKAAQFDQLKDSQKTEVEKLTERIARLEREKADLETASKTERIRSTTVRTAAKLGYADPEDAYALLPREDVAEDGSNVEQLLSDLLKSKPYLSSGRVTGSADGGNKGEATNGKVDENTLIRAALQGR